MQLVDRIEKRRFVGREFLLWLWFESEVFEGTLATAKHGSFGLWIERQLVLSAGKESTRIKGALPGAAREAKESVLRGKLPESAGVHLSRGAEERTFVLKAEQMAIGGLALQTVLGGPASEENALAPARRPQPKKRRRDAAAEAERESDEAHEAFYERMRMTRDLEALVEALYRDFLALRLGDAWSDAVVPAMRAWALGEEVDADSYRAARDHALAPALPRVGARAR